MVSRSRHRIKIVAAAVQEALGSGRTMTLGNSRPAPYAPGPYAMLSAFTQDSLPIGTEIDVDGYLATTAGSATDRDVTFPDGR